jgi:tRNA-dihydrouridine synthase A
MIGRAVYANPYLLAEIQSHFLAAKPLPTRNEIIKKYVPYVYKQVKNGVRLSAMTRHILGLYHGERGASSWRRYLSEHAHKPGANVEVIEQALHYASSAP